MVQNLINQVKNAETEAENIILKANETKKNLIDKAKKDAIEFRKNIEAEANKRGEELLVEKKKECEDLDLIAEKEAEIEVNKILAKGANMEDEVMDDIISYIFN